jgi:aldose 1-epimerase
VNTLAAGPAVVEVSPAQGGRIAQITVAGTPLLVDELDATAVEGASAAEVDPVSWGAFPLVPWAGRIGHGRFSFQGSWYEVDGVRLDGHPVHGRGVLTSWDVLDVGRDHIEMQCPLDWVFRGTAHQHIQLTPVAVVAVLSVLAADRAMPATIGWHPWFRRPAQDRLEFGTMYERGADHLPTGELVAPTPRPWDDCFLEPSAPLRLAYDGGPTVTIASDCDHWTVYDERPYAVCVEPQSGPPDAVNMGRAAVLAPGELLQRTMTIAWSDVGARRSGGRRPAGR